MRWIGGLLLAFWIIVTFALFGGKCDIESWGFLMFFSGIFGMIGAAYAYMMTHP